MCVCVYVCMYMYNKVATFLKFSILKKGNRDLMETSNDQKGMEINKDQNR